MSYKSIAVHLDTSERARQRLELALGLAQRFDAHITGVFSVLTPDPHSFEVMAGTADYYPEHESLRRERRAALEHLFRTETMRAKVPADWISTDEYANHGRPRPRPLRGPDRGRPGQSGRPRGLRRRSFPRSARHVGWPSCVDGSVCGQVSVGWHPDHRGVERQPWGDACRARCAAVPAACRADDHRDRERRERRAVGSPIPGADIAAVIARHGVAVEVREFVSSHTDSTGDALLSHAADDGSDLLVMGAYDHARWQERMMGGATRSMFQSMTLPVLMSN